MRPANICGDRYSRRVRTGRQHVRGFPIETQIVAPKAWHILSRAYGAAAHSVATDNTVSYVILAIFAVIDGALMRNEKSTGIALFNNAYPLTNFLLVIANFFTLAAAMRTRIPDYRLTFRSAVDILAIVLMTVIGTLMGLFCLIVPGVWIGTKFSLAPYAYLLHPGTSAYSSTDALTESWNITNKHFWPTAGLFLMQFLVVGLPIVLCEIAALRLFVSNHNSAYVTAPIFLLLGVYGGQILNLSMLEWTEYLRVAAAKAHVDAV